MARDFTNESLSFDPIHGYIPFISASGLPEGEVAEEQIINHPWVQRLRQIHQLQTAWWVFPSAEHTRFQHVLGAMHLASRAVEELYPTLEEACPDVPGRGYVESLMRMAALLHDVGHGPFGHFFDANFLADFGLTHETLGAHIIRHELGDLLRRVRRNPKGRLEAGQSLDPDQIALLITRPKQTDKHDLPGWLTLLRSLFSGLYTVDNMDFVLRDAYMSGYSTKAFDLQRLLHYSVFTSRGLTIHERGLSAQVRFISVRAENRKGHRCVFDVDFRFNFASHDDSFRHG
ncbi:MAG: HD domain-containing protein, partial [Planctomycetes bacterium]|nr:HD domain-containing protein [Planctomycetota bacterium]